MIKICPICGGEFKAKPSNLKIGKDKFCSKKCYGKSKVGIFPKQLIGIIQKGKRTNTGRTHFKKGFTPWNKGMKGFLAGEKHYRWGKHLAKEVKEKISEHRKGKYTGEENFNWKGEKVGYRALHDWISDRKGKAKKCEICGSTGGKHACHLANISHKYFRDINDFISLCPKCHGEYDAGKLEIKPNSN